MSFIVIATIIMTFNFNHYFQRIERPFRHLWSLCIALLQIYIVHIAGMVPSDQKENDVISHNDTSVLLIEKLSTLQILPTMFLFIRRVLFLCGIVILPPAYYLEGIILILEDVYVTFFYLKVLLVCVKANVSVDNMGA